MRLAFVPAKPASESKGTIWALWSRTRQQHAPSTDVRGDGALPKGFREEQLQRSITWCFAGGGHCAHAKECSQDASAVASRSMTLGSVRARIDHTVAIVVPVYHGEETLPALLEELEPLAGPQVSSAGNRFRISEVVLVHDSGPDLSDVVIRALARRYDFVRPVWLARNFGQHAATLAGMSSSSADWIVTMDEDGQHDPEAIGSMLDVALSTGSPLVYADPTNKPPHSTFRNVASRAAHGLARVMGAGDLRHFHSFRLVLGEVGRGLAAYCGESVYLDVALTWVVNRTATCPVAMRAERGRASGYSTRRLASHMWRMVLTSGTRPLRLVALVGAVLGIAAVGLVGWVIVAKVTHHVPVQGWTSVMVILLVTSGGILFSLGILAEYLGVAAKSAMGKPLYLVVSDPAEGPLGRAASPAAPTEVETAEPARDAEPAARTEG
jgi:polyisoprenyl-phosphate glycosyltransferase